MSMSFSERVSAATEAVSSLTPQQASALAGSADVVFVDPRPSSAIAASTGIIPGAWNIPLDQLSAGQLPQELTDRSIHVITSCQAGPMGAIAAHELARQGFARVHYIEGGTQGWLDAGFTTNR